MVETIKDVKTMGSLHKNQFSFGNELKLAEKAAPVHVDDLLAHFENFNIEDLQASVSPVLRRSITERNVLSPNRSKEMDTGEKMSKNLKDELDFKKVRLLELEAENGEMKTQIEQMT